MPVLNSARKSEQQARLDLVPVFDGDLRAGSAGAEYRVQDGARFGLFQTCSYAGCSSGWLKIWRSRTTPVFESGWCCSPECTAAQVAAALRRELETMGHPVQGHRHRIPLGLAMLEQGWITKAQLRGALAAQRAAGGGRLGQWLVRREGVSEQLVTRALGLQWGCPVLRLESHDAEAFTPCLPRLFVDAYGVLPLRIAAGKILYLGFQDRLDPVLALATERMTGLRVESGLVRESEFLPAHQRMLQARFPHVELIEASSEPSLVRALARRLERFRPIESRLVRVHDCLWLRMWSRVQRGPLPEPAHIEDLICSLRPA
jgi:hypothetical protein